MRARVPWVPPGKNTAPRDHYKWEVGSVDFVWSSFTLTFPNHDCWSCQCVCNTPLSDASQGSSHCLEITPVPQSDVGSSPLRLADLSKDEQGDEAGCDNRSKYDRRADSLMSEVDPLMRKVGLYNSSLCACVAV